MVLFKIMPSHNKIIFKKKYSLSAILLFVSFNIIFYFCNSATYIVVPIKNCGCKKKIMLNFNLKSKDVRYNETTCGEFSWRRGFNQKVIAFSFYGDTKGPIAKAKKYFEGIYWNSISMQKYYPGWIMRVYYDLEPSHPLMKSICDLTCQNPILDICYVKELPGTPMKDASNVFAMNWRFFPTLDPQVDIYASRDLDSKFSLREILAVNEWLSSKKILHSMRDHPQHNIPLLGAAWGSNMRQKYARENWKNSWKKILKDPLTFSKRSKKGPDQTILKRYVWTWGAKYSIQHDSYTCNLFPGSIPFPTRRQKKVNNFVAAVWNENRTLWTDCPKQCRKRADWSKC